jgi:cysteinyl-tRNA synthetase
MRRFTVFDTLSRETRVFAPLVPPKVGLFVCGLTPYSEPHIGHAKLAVTFDVVARALRHWGYRVFYVQNVTNLDDRLIARGGEEGVDPLALAERNFHSWMASMERLGVASVNYYPRATDYVPEIIDQVQTLVEKGFAYASEGSVYYDVARFPSYGQLSGQRTDALRAGARVEVDHSKRTAEDFVLWKATTPGEPSWSSPWGPGRPGWHIEDTAITVRLLGPRYDLHGGGVDLKFPHHEAEIAQAEAATGESPLVNYWMHMGLLMLKGEKMSKSLGNGVALADCLEQFGPSVVRFFYLNAHYRSPLDFVPGKSLEEAREAYATLSAPSERLAQAMAGPERTGEPLPAATEREAESTVEALDHALAEDFNTREAIAVLFRWGRTLGPFLERLDGLSPDAIATLDEPYEWAREVLGLPSVPAPSADAGPVVDVAIEARARARTRGDYTEADRIRDDLARAGIQLQDGGGATRWKQAPAPGP